MVVHFEPIQFSVNFVNKLGDKKVILAIGCKKESTCCARAKIIDSQRTTDKRQKVPFDKTLWNSGKKFPISNEK